MELDTTNLTAMERVGVFLPLVFAIIAYPYTFGAIKRLQVSRARYGHRAVRILGVDQRVLQTVRQGVLIGFLALLCFVFLTAVVIFTPIIFIPMVGMLMIPFAYLVAGAATLGYLRSRIGNLVFRSITLAGEARFESTLSAMGLARILSDQPDRHHLVAGPARSMGGHPRGALSRRMPRPDHDGRP